MNFYRPIWSDASIERLHDIMCSHLITAPSVNTGTWQAKKDTPMSKTRELLNVLVEIPIAATPGAWASYMRPNLPWADQHFEERVCGKPLNPPPSHINWPFAQRGNEAHLADGEVYSHSYPERMWPKFAGNLGHAKAQTACERGLRGIRFDYGDLGDLVALLTREPRTRQAYMPMFVHEDITAALEEHRVPCSLGWHFLLRGNRLHCFYSMRSCDALRYFNDDCYFAGRLVQWVIQEARKRSDENSIWHEVEPGVLTFFATSFHCFEGDVAGIRHRLDKQRNKQQKAMA